MSEISEKSNPTICEGLHNVISSPASADGPMPCDSPAGPMTNQSGPGVVPASRSAPPASKKGSQTSATCGPSGSISSASASLASFLASRLRVLLPGSILFRETWKEKATPAGRRLWAHTASALRTSGSDCTGWLTTRESDGEKNVRSLEGSMREMERKGGPQDLNQAATLAAWPTTTWKDFASTGARNYSTASGRHSGTTLTDAVRMIENSARTAAPVSVSTPATVRVDASNVAIWPTASARDWKSCASNKHGENARPLNEVARLAFWATPASREAGATPERFLERKEALGGACGVSLTSLNLQPKLVHSGQTLPGSLVATVSPGQLNPAHSRWLMGFPAEWDACAPTVTRSSRKSPRPL